MAEKITIARPYATAAFELAREHDDLDQWSRTLENAANVARDGRVREMLLSPTVTPDELAGLFVGICRESGAWGGSVEEMGDNFLRLLAHNRRLGLLPEIAEVFDAMKAEVENTIEVTLVSAREVDEAHRAKIVQALGSRLGRDVHLHCEIDESLIGGAIVRAEDLVIDGSMRGRLEKLAGAMAY
ncbi:MAG: F0F1 ATP synthase subunit delta [Gammaproteobacteria bacterium]|nr:F0F1 ATP synthase subunit delta [Gammaproteobacteria bacterium]